MLHHVGRARTLFGSAKGRRENTSRRARLPTLAVSALYTEPYQMVRGEMRGQRERLSRWALFPLGSARPQPLRSPRRYGSNAARLLLPPV